MRSQVARPAIMLCAVACFRTGVGMFLIFNCQCEGFMPAFLRVAGGGPRPVARWVLRWRVHATICLVNSRGTTQILVSVVTGSPMQYSVFAPPRGWKRFA